MGFKGFISPTLGSFLPSFLPSFHGLLSRIHFRFSTPSAQRLSLSFCFHSRSLDRFYVRSRFILHFWRRCMWCLRFASCAITRDIPRNKTSRLACAFSRRVGYISFRCCVCPTRRFRSGALRIRWPSPPRYDNRAPVLAEKRRVVLYPYCIVGSTNPWTVPVGWIKGNVSATA